MKSEGKVAKGLAESGGENAYEKTPVAKWIIQKYLEWQASTREKKTLEDAANYLNMKRTTLAMHMGGQRMPDSESVPKYAKAWGMEIYDLMGLVRPDSDLREIIATWDLLPKTFRLKIKTMCKEEAAKTEMIRNR